jgi:DNA-binding Xre family transcriptional regulator
MASLYELEFYFRKCYDNSISDDFKEVYSQKEKELKELEDTFEIHIQTELNKINSSMLFDLHNQNKFIYLHKQNIFEDKSLIDIVHGIVKEDTDFVSIWYHKSNILNQHEEYIEISKKKLSEIKNRDVLLINFDIEHIYYPSEKMYVDNHDFVKEYYHKLNELS